MFETTPSRLVATSSVAGTAITIDPVFPLSAHVDNALRLYGQAVPAAFSGVPHE